MKKKIALGVLAFSLIAGTAYGANKGIQLVVNGQTVKAEAQIINGVTMVPVRAVGEALGGSASYDKANGRVTVTTPPAASEGLTLEQLNKIGESVGLVYVYDASNNLLGTGSGFITHGDVFVTNAHVAGIGSTIRVEFSSQDAVTLQTKDALFNDAKKDLFGIRLPGHPSLQLNTAVPENRAHVYDLGFPHRRFTITEGQVKYKLADFDASLIVHDAATDHGSSGGILIDDSGKVVGINGYIEENLNLNSAIQSKVLESLLNV